MIAGRYTHEALFSRITCNPGQPACLHDAWPKSL
jgi:hypothetical protein